MAIDWPPFDAADYNPKNDTYTVPGPAYAAMHRVAERLNAMASDDKPMRACNQKCRTTEPALDAHQTSPGQGWPYGKSNEAGTRTIIRDIGGAQRHINRMVSQELDKSPMRTFASGATRNLSEHKIDFAGHLSPEVLEEFGAYMHSHRIQADGTTRASDNWKKGITKEAYGQSLFRHVMDFMRAHNGIVVIDKDTNKVVHRKDLLCAIMFNAMGYLFELLVDEGRANRKKVA